LVIIHKDNGNASRQIREIKLDNDKIQGFLDDINKTQNKGVVNVNEKFMVIIKTKKSKEIRLIGQDMILFDKENGNYYNADFNWTIKYWDKDLTRGGF